MILKKSSGDEGVVLLKHEISLKVICEKVKFLICDFSTNFHDYEWTYIYAIKNIVNDVQTKGKGEINTAKITTLKLVYFDTILVEGLKSKFFN